MLLSLSRRKVLELLIIYGIIQENSGVTIFTCTQRGEDLFGAK